MLRAELAELKTGKPELRKFGLLVGGVLILLGGWFWWRGRDFHFWFWVPGAVLAAAGAVFPGALRRIYLGWMGMALALGWVVATVVLSIFFYLVLTPIGWAARIAGKDFLDRQLRPGVPSYWLVRDRSSTRRNEHYKHQY